MKSCENIHKEYDHLAHGKIRAGKLPAWTHVNGKVAWYVFQGPYSQLQHGWSTFWDKFRAAGLSMEGAPGDVYVCPPEEHAGEEEKTLTTIIWAPLKNEQT